MRPWYRLARAANRRRRAVCEVDDLEELARRGRLRRRATAPPPAPPRAPPPPGPPTTTRGRPPARTPRGRPDAGWGSMSATPRAERVEPARSGPPPQPA